MRTKFWQNYYLGKGFAKTSAHLFLNSDVANGKGGVWGGIFHLLLFLFWGNSGRTKNTEVQYCASTILLFFVPDLKGSILGIRLGHFRWGYSRLDV